MVHLNINKKCAFLAALWSFSEVGSLQAHELVLVELIAMERLTSSGEVPQTMKTNNMSMHFPEMVFKHGIIE